MMENFQKLPLLHNNEMTAMNNQMALDSIFCRHFVSERASEKKGNTVNLTLLLSVTMTNDRKFDVEKIEINLAFSLTLSPSSCVLTTFFLRPRCPAQLPLKLIFNLVNCWVASPSSSERKQWQARWEGVVWGRKKLRLCR